MKKLTTLIVTALITVGVFCQIPQKMSYQAVIRNSSDELITSSTIGMQISILQGSESGTPIYVETHSTSTNNNGLVTVEIGGGTPVTGTFSDIDWSTGIYFLETETDPAGGTSYSITGTSQLLSVPYALYAKNVENLDAIMQKLQDLEDIVITQLPLPTDGLVANYPFNGNANDESGNGFNGVVNNAVLTTDRFGVANSAYSFSENQDITVPNSQDQNLYPISISLWYNVSSTPDNSPGSNIFSKYTPASWNGYQILTSDDRNVGNQGIYINNGYGTPSWYIRSPENKVLGYYDEDPFLQTFISFNTWYHYVFVLDETGGKIYVDGQLIDTHAWTGTSGPCDNLLAWKIGGMYTDWYKGKIDDIRIYNRGLSETEIRQLYNEDGYPNTIVTDIDGNSYNTVKIGNQVWMSENLKTTKYRNGELIGTTTPSTLDITSESTPKYQWAYGGNESNVTTYGRLYTWYAMTDSRNICPSGWHVATDSEWTILTDYLTNNGYGYQGSGSDIGKSMAAASGWRTHSTPGNVGNDQASNNSSGFTALPGGSRWPNGSFVYINDDSYWWCYSVSPLVANRFMNFYSDSVSRSSGSVPAGGTGSSVRCIKD